MPFREEVSSIILQLHPATGDDDDKKFVCMTLQLDPPAGYPDELPEISIRNPRGIGDEEIQRYGKCSKILKTFLFPFSNKIYILLKL